MKSFLERLPSRALALALLAAVSSTSMLARAQDYPTAIGYQGQLYQQGQPVTGAYRMTFRPYDAASGGTALAAAVTVDNVQVLGGQFFASLDFGADLYSVAPVWIQITAAPMSNPSASVTFAPRQKLMPVPAAVNADRVDGMEAAELVASSGSLIKREAFEFRSIPGVGLPPAVLSTITVTPPYSGELLLRSRGYCNVSALSNSNNAISLAIGSDITTAFTPANVSEWGVAEVPRGTSDMTYPI